MPGRHRPRSRGRRCSSGPAAGTASPLFPRYRCAAPKRPVRPSGRSPGVRRDAACCGADRRAVGDVGCAWSSTNDLLDLTGDPGKLGIVVARDDDVDWWTTWPREAGLADAELQPGNALAERARFV